MTRTLVLLRHGRTPWNHEGRVQGHQDVGLDDVGLAQAAAAAPVLAASAPALLWASDLTRARQTAAAVSASCGLDVRLDERLREFSFGATEGLSHAELAESDPVSYVALRRGDYDQVTGAEATTAVVARMTSVLRDLLAALEPEQTAIAVSHGAAIRVAVGAMLGWAEGQFHTLRGLDNCGWAVLAEHPADGVLRLLAYNRTA